MSGKMFTMEYKVGNFVRRTEVLETNMCAIRNNLGELIHMVKRKFGPSSLSSRIDCFLFCFAHFKCHQGHMLTH
jgi:hypothetical protein